MAPPATLEVFNIIRNSAGAGIAGARVNCTLSISYATVTATGDSIDEIQQTTETDGNGRYAFTIVANDLLSPANTTYTIQEPHRSYQIAPQSGNGSSQQTTAANVIVNVPTALAAATSNVTGPLTVTGALTVTGLGTFSAGLTLSGGSFSIPAGGFSMAGPLTLTAATSQIIPGATSFSVRNNANGADNLLVSNAGLVTARAGLVATAGGVTATAGDVAITAGNLTLGAAASRIVPGVTSLSLRNNANSADNLILTDAGVATIRAGLTVTAGGLTITAGGETITAGNLTLTAGNLIFAAAAAKILPGATSLTFRNNADSASNLAITDAGLMTARNALEVPPSAGASLPTHGYGTLAIKLDEQSTASATSVTLTVPSGGLYRTLELEIEGRSDQAGAQAVFVQFNADTGANYDYQYISDANVTITGVAPSVAATQGKIGAICASGATAGAIASYHVVIINADSTTQRKNWEFHGHRWDTDAAASAVLEVGQGQWRNTANAITSVKVLCTTGNLINFRAVLYGKS